MALSTRKKNMIVADWKTGAYSQNALAKKYKISTSTANKILKNIPQSNIDIVEVCETSERMKKRIKTNSEIKAVENVVKNRLKVHDITKNLLKKTNAFIKKGKVQRVTTANTGDGVIEANIVETDLQSSDYKNLADTIDKASLTLGVNPRFSNSQINIQNNQQNITEIKRTIVDIKH